MGDARTRAHAMPPGYRRDTAGQETEAMSATGRRRSRRSRDRGGPGGPSGPGRTGGPGGTGPGGPGGPGLEDEDDEPRRTGWKRFIPSWKIVLAGSAVVTAGLFGMIAVGYANTPLPSERNAQESAIAQGSTFYYRDGKQVLARLGTKRVAITIDQVPQHVRDAVVSAENRTFYEDSGIDLMAVIRSVIMTAIGQPQGGSTITQQMARNYFDGLSQERSAQRKIKEIFIAVKLNKEWEKDRVLEYYLNTVSFGRNTYGIEAAAREFFGVPARKLTVAQGAYLAGRIQQPSGFDEAEARKDFGPTQRRFDYVIAGMAEMTDERGAPKYPNLVNTAKFPKPKPKRNSEEFGGLRGYMLSQALYELSTRKISREEVERGGYKIVTTFDKNLMQAAKKAVVSTLAGRSKEFHAGLAAVDPKTGRVLAFYGGNDYATDPWNEPFDSKKQAASAFKPYVLAAWLDAGHSLDSWLPGDVTVPDPLPNTKKISNGHAVPKAIDAVYATAHSINTAFASMAYKLDEEAGTIGQLSAVKRIAIDAGLNEARMEQDVKEHQYAFSIGSALVTPVEQAAGYSIFANEGKHIDYHVIQSVRKDGVLVLPEERDVKQVISPEAAADAVAAMEQVLKSGTAGGKGIGRPAAGKTGTNNDEKEAWFVGFTPQLSTAVGLYREECRTKSGKVVPPVRSNCPVTPGGKPSKKYGPNNPYTRPYEVSLNFEGAGPPTDIWRAFMTAAHASKPVVPFPQKAGTGAPENIVPSPTPTPSPTPELDEFPADFLPNFPPDGEIIDEDCPPGDPTCAVQVGPDFERFGGPNGGPGGGNGRPAYAALTRVPTRSDPRLVPARTAY